MTLTVRLDTDLEQTLRKRCTSVGQSASVLIREALGADLYDSTTKSNDKDV